MNGHSVSVSAIRSQEVPLRTGPPTKEELLVHYPARFTWNQLKTFVNSGDFGLLKRDKKLQVRYDAWAVGIVAKYGSMVNYLLEHRLQWGKPDTLSLLKSTLDDERSDEQIINVASGGDHMPILSDDAPKYFKSDVPPEYISIIQNDWPYSVPPDVEHSLIWTRIPIFHPDIVAESIKSRIEQDGVWGFTGNLSPPPSPLNLHSCLPALADWGITFATMIKSEKGTEEEEELVRRVGEEVNKFVINRWSEKDWETAWFVNPPRLQSVPGLAHVHVFARRKTA